MKKEDLTHSEKPMMTSPSLLTISINENFVERFMQDVQIPEAIPSLYFSNERTMGIVFEGRGDLLCIFNRVLPGSV